MEPNVHMTPSGRKLRPCVLTKRPFQRHRCAPNVASISSPPSQTPQNFGTNTTNSKRQLDKIFIKGRETTCPPATLCMTRKQTTHLPPLSVRKTRPPRPGASALVERTEHGTFGGASTRQRALYPSFPLFVGSQTIRRDEPLPVSQGRRRCTRGHRQW